MINFEVTLKQLRDHKFYVSGYNKIICKLKNVPYEEKNNYIKYKHESPIKLLFILESNGLYDALWCLRCNAKFKEDSNCFTEWFSKEYNLTLENEHISDSAFEVALWFALKNAWNNSILDSVNYSKNSAIDDFDIIENNQKEMFIKMCNGNATWQKGDK